MYFKRCSPAILLLVLIQFTPFAAFSQYFTGSVAGAIGDAGVAANDSGEETFLNPAVIAHAPMFTANLVYRDGYSNPGEHHTLLGLNLVDNNKDAIFPGSFAYLQNRRTFRGAAPLDEQYFQVSVGNFLGHQVAMGFSLVYLQSDQTGGQKHDQVNGVAGLHWNPTPDLGVGLVHYNLASADKDVPAYFRLVPKTVVGVTYIFTKFFRTRLDLGRPWQLNPDEEYQLAGGFETILNDFMILRMGFRTDGVAKRDTFTTGFGFVGPRFQINYAFRKNTKGTRGALHSVDLVMPF